MSLLAWIKIRFFHEVVVFFPRGSDGNWNPRERETPCSFIPERSVYVRVWRIENVRLLRAPAHNARSKRLGHSDNPALLHTGTPRWGHRSRKGETYKERLSSNDTIQRATRVPIAHYCMALLIVRRRTIELAVYTSVSRFSSGRESCAYRYIGSVRNCIPYRILCCGIRMKNIYYVQV